MMLQRIRESYEGSSSHFHVICTSLYEELSRFERTTHCKYFICPRIGKQVSFEVHHGPSSTAEASQEEHHPGLRYSAAGSPISSSASDVLSTEKRASEGPTNKSKPAGGTPAGYPYSRSRKAV